MSVDNLYQHADGDFYCLLSEDAPMKHPDSGDWLPGVIYTGTDNQMRSTTRARWDERFVAVAEYTGDDESVMSMIRRCNPGNTDFDFVRVFESWHESEMNITGSMLELAVAATLERTHLDPHKGKPIFLVPNERHYDSVKLTITTEDLQRVLQTYDITKEAIPHGFVFHIRK